MLTETLKNQLHSIIEEIDDAETLKAAHLLLSQKTERDFQNNPHWTDEQIMELDRRWKEHLSGKSKSYSLKEVKERARRQIVG